MNIELAMVTPGLWMVPELPGAAGEAAGRGSRLAQASGTATGASVIFDRPNEIIEVQVTQELLDYFCAVVLTNSYFR